ncbi:MAG: peptidoglycan-binding domain-containing protein [Actinomycetota bacterium]|nr:peptidoglycan-binding domain-containing protein [Actinomycetota bacterium]MDA3037708.1 peptidoglycan-binding domain-containing protein [Actinomycetota bacterium]
MGYIDELSSDELLDLSNKIQAAGYQFPTDAVDCKALVELFLNDYNLNKNISKENLWLELLNHGYNLGDRILNFSNPVLKGSDVEELQEMLSRLGFYSEPINSVYTKELMKAVEAFQENRGLGVDGVVGLNTAIEIKKLIRPTLDKSLNEAIKGFKLPGSTFNICINVENNGEYREQVVFYELIKGAGTENGMNVTFVSEAGEEMSKENTISFVNKINPTLFLTFENSETQSVNYFVGKHSISSIGKKLADEISGKLNFDSIGKNNLLLKNTRAVSLVINGNFYQINVKTVFDIVSEVYSEIF